MLKTILNYTTIQYSLQLYLCSKDPFYLSCGNSHELPSPGGCVRLYWLKPHDILYYLMPGVRNTLSHFIPRQACNIYGAPVLARGLTQRTSSRLIACQRVMAIRFIRGYRTVSTEEPREGAARRFAAAGEAANLLAGMPSWDLEAPALADGHRWREAALSRGESDRQLLSTVDVT